MLVLKMIHPKINFFILNMVIIMKKFGYNCCC